MKKQDLFLAAMLAEEFRRKAWVVSAFSLINEAPDAWRKDPYPYRIVQTPTGHFFVRGIEGSGWVIEPIEDTVAGQPPFNVKERVSYTPDQVTQLSETTEATYGQWLANYAVNFWAFGNRLGFLKGRFGPSTMEPLIVPRLKDTPSDPAARNDKEIYVDELLKYFAGMFFIAGFTQLCVPAATPKSMVAPPGIVELKNRLLEENKDRLHDPAVIAKIDAALVAYDREWLKGDAAEGFLLGSKSFQVVRKKMFGMHGAEMGLAESADVTLIKNSLSEGWDISAWPAMNDSLRAGSFNRGALTMLGGESVKWLLRASSNITVTQDDCGARMGIDFTATPENYTWLTGFHVIQAQGSKQVVSDEDAKSYIGRNLHVRSPMFCKLEKTDYCKVCVGARLADNPTGLSTALSQTGSAFLGIYMSAAHGKALTLAKMEIKNAIT